MAIYRGLNTTLALNDIDDKDEALLNLGLDRRDLDVISGLATALGSGRGDEFRTISGLDLDQKKELYAVARSGATLDNLLTGLEDIQQPLRFDLQIDNQLRASAIKYTYIDFANSFGNPNAPLKSADISTSRVSSWSSTADPVTLTSPIFYGGELEVVGDGSGSNIELSELEILDAPQQTQFAAEEATHLITIDINGTPQQFYAMKGIPLQYETFFRNTTLTCAIKTGTTTPAWKIINLDDGAERSRENVQYTFRDTRSRPRLVELYANPKNLLTIEITSANLIELPAVSLPDLTRYNLSYNDFYQLPDFSTLAPSLQELYMTGNNLSRAKDANGNQITANTQLNTISTAANPPLRVLNVTGCFSDSEAVDLTKYTNLTDLTFNAYYARYSARSMTGGTVTPEIAPSIVNYSVDSQPAFNKLAYTVTQAPNLRSINLNWCNIDAARNSGGSNVDVTLASTALTSFSSYSNSHNVVDVSNKTSLSYYVHAYSRGLRGLGGAGANISGKFAGCSSLGTISFYATDVEGTVTTAFQNLGSLSSVDIRWTRLSGGFDDDSFDGTTNLGYLYMAGSFHNGTMFPPSPVDGGPSRVFHNTKGLRRFYMYSNGGFQGSLPDFSQNPSLNVLYINNTGMSGTLPNFSQNTSLWGMYMWSNNFTGAPPALNGSGFYYVYLNNNNLSGQIPTLVGASNIRRWYLHNNQLSGSLPNLSGLPNLEYMLVQNQRADGNGNAGLTGYTSGAIATNTRLRRLDISNNNISLQAARDIINDALLNYNANRRRGVTINMLGNPNVVESNVASIQGIADNLQFLRDSGWTILMN